MTDIPPEDLLYLLGLPLVVSGAVPVRARFRIPLSIRACGFPAHGLPMVFLAWLRSSRIADGASEAIKAMVLKPVTSPRIGTPGMQVTAVTFDEQTFQSPHDVAVDLVELVGGVPGTKVAAPATQNRVDLGGG